MIETISPMLPLAAQIPASALLTILLVIALWIARGVSARFVIIACWLRFMAAAFHIYTFQPIVANQSAVSIVSGGVFATGVLLLPFTALLRRYLLPTYLVIISIVLSAVLNHRIGPSFEALVKFGYFMVIGLHTVNALAKSDRRRFGFGLLLAFAPLIVFQMLSLVLGVAKYSIWDNSWNYIGGYFHEATFSVALVALFISAVFVTEVPGKIRAVVGAVALIGILFANYRTAIAAMAPLFVYFFARAVGTVTQRKLRPLVVMIGAMAALGAIAGVVSTSERYVDLRLLALGQGPPILQRPEHFTLSERNSLSGRSYIWSNYFYAWKDGDAPTHLVGFGPDAWEEHFELYAHNTFIGFLYEYGLIGLAALVLLMGTSFAAVFKADQDERPKLVAAHLSFFLLNMATMPLWQIEGLILYGLLWGFTMDRVAQGARQRLGLIDRGRRAVPIAQRLNLAGTPRAEPISE